MTGRSTRRGWRFCRPLPHSRVGGAGPPAVRLTLPLRFRVTPSRALYNLELANKSFDEILDHIVQPRRIFLFFIDTLTNTETN